MKKFLTSAATLALLLPAFASAAFNDVSLVVTNAVLSVNGATLTVSGSNAEIQSIAVGSTSFSVTLAPASSIQVTPTDRNKLTASDTSFVTVDTCSDTEAVMKLANSSASTKTVTVTVGTGACNAPSGGGGSGGSGSGSGGGGGGGSSASTPAPSPTPASPMLSGDVAGLVAQLRTLIQLYVSLGGAVSPEMAAFAGPSAPAGGAFTRDLEVGTTGDDVKSLQQWLNANGFQVAASGPGSPGSETTMYGAATRAAVIKLQQSKGITPAVGYFGPKTRAAIGQ